MRVPEVRLVGPGGEQVGVVRIEVALSLAQDADLDLVEVAPDARPPVCKLMDFGKFKYESDMKAREARRNQANTVLKEIRFRLKIDPHDYGTKKGHVERFLAAGDKVKVMIMFRGREQSRPEMGIRLLQRLAEDVAELGFVESSPKQDGRNMIMVLGPVKKKAEAKNEQRRRAQEAEPRLTKSAAKAGSVEAPEEIEDGVEAPFEEIETGVEVPFEVQVAEAAEMVASAEAAAAVKAAAAPEPAPAPVAEAAPAAAPKAAAPRSSAPKAAPRTSAPKAPAAPKAAAPAAPAAAPKPAVAPKPVAVPKPAAMPKPPAPRPAAPKPGTAAKPKPGGKPS
ncbi:translation initiation factor IF-3 [Oerskovia enterophila]|uniref:translation initiation factor IF-3 n=1 Tax=Oerskovia enterophila TaxID=43678 RepID=UPI000838980A|nr:translation initiation factor IF-3 [Oerskovia enterophila]